MDRACAVVVAAGKSSRMGRGINKQLILLAGEPVLKRTLSVLDRTSSLDEVVLVVPPDGLPEFRIRVLKWNIEKVKEIVPGGENRQQSVLSGLLAVSSGCGTVLVHDGARPMITTSDVERVLEAGRQFGASTMAVPVKETIKEADTGGFVAGTPDRGRLWVTQTPQVFSYRILMEAHQLARDGKITLPGEGAPDDACLVEAMGNRVKIVHGSYRNIKITTPEDLAAAEAMLREVEPGGRPSGLRIGFGYDVHKLAPGRKLVLGGVELPYELGLFGHSDADVLVHAVMDALLGAAGLGDIGMLFPDTDARFRDANSLELLSAVKQELTLSGYAPAGVDATVVAQAPKLAGYRDRMRRNIAEATGLDISDVNVKATTTEGLGFTGTGEGMAAYAVAMVLPLKISW